jgi:hypothetical protein
MPTAIRCAAREVGRTYRADEIRAADIAYPWRATAVALLSLVAGLALTLWAARVATSQRERADRRFNEVRQLAKLGLIFTLHDAVAPLPGSTPVRQQIVSEGLKYLEGLPGADVR